MDDRVNLYKPRKSRGTWREAEEAAEADSVSLSVFTALALRQYLDRRRAALTRAKAAK